MPNPFIRLGMGASQSKPPPEREIPDTPVPDEIVYSGIPYMGQNNHGVEVSNSEWNEELTNEINQESEIEYVIPEPEKPIPVRIVGDSSSAREIKDWRVSRSYAGVSSPAQIVGRFDKRQSVKIKNLGSVKIWIGDSAFNANSVNGYPIDANGVESLDSTQDVWAIADSGTDPVPVAILVEYSLAAD